MQVGDVVRVETHTHPHEIKYLGKVGTVIDILGTSTGDDGKDEEIVTISIMGIEEVFMENQLDILYFESSRDKKKRKQRGQNNG